MNQSGSDIKGEMKSYDELLKACGFARRASTVFPVASKLRLRGLPMIGPVRLVLVGTAGPQEVRVDLGRLLDFL